jgi:hypothetical protein
MKVSKLLYMAGKNNEFIVIHTVDPGDDKTGKDVGK